MGKFLWVNSYMSEYRQVSELACTLRQIAPPAQAIYHKQVLFLILQAALCEKRGGQACERLIRVECCGRSLFVLGWLGSASIGIGLAVQQWQTLAGALAPRAK
jgi:hypothetical protein